MFNPKGPSLIDEQLAYSGLEMNWFPAVMAGISAVATIAGGISQSQQNKKNNERADKNYKEQKEASERIADRTNEHNKRVHQADLANYYSNRAYEWETTLRNYKYNKSIQDYNFLSTAKQYEASVANTEKQLVYNSMAAMEAQESEQAALNEILAEDAFQREGLLVEQMQAQGRAALLQAGGSRAKAMQSQAAKIGRDSAVMSASLNSARAQSERNMRDIALGKFIDDQNVMSTMMIRPDRLPELPPPIQAPERIFIEPMEVDPQYIAPPLKQSTFAPIVQSVGSAAGGLMKADLAGAFK